MVNSARTKNKTTHTELPVTYEVDESITGLTRILFAIQQEDVDDDVRKGFISQGKRKKEGHRVEIKLYI